MAEESSPQPHFHVEGACDIRSFERLLHSARTEKSAYPLASRVDSEVLIYDRRTLEAAAPREVKVEIVRALTEGPGIVVIRNAFADLGILAAVSEAFQEIVRQEAGQTAGDHFAAAGSNTRIWNSLEKLGVLDPGAFCRYFSNPTLALVSEAYLGPGYAVTAQVNIVHPGGSGQEPHLDYHLGFRTNEEVEAFPAHAHLVSSLLTLQGAVAHSDMPIESGPTQYLPHSHKYRPGYLAWRQQPFKDYFKAHHVQLPLVAGDAVFFCPALFHAAGPNTTRDMHREGHLLQISSAFGRPMETVDRSRLSSAIYPQLLLLRSAGTMSDQDLERIIAAGSDGNPFPSNLDREAPRPGGLAPPSQGELMRQALQEGWSPEAFDSALQTQDQRRRSA